MTQSTREGGEPLMDLDLTVDWKEDGISAYSDTTKKTYPNWDALLAAESHGYCIVSTSERPKTVPAVHGLYADKAEAKRAQVRLRSKFRREEAPFKVKVYIRVIWKEKP